MSYENDIETLKQVKALLVPMSNRYLDDGDIQHANVANDIVAAIEAMNDAIAGIEELKPIDTRGLGL